MSWKKHILPGILTGVMLALAFPPLPMFMLAWIGLVPLLMAFETELAPKRPFLLVYITFFIYHYASNWWISSWQAESDPYLMAAGFATALVHPFFFFIPIGIYLYLKRKLGSGYALALLPFVWTAFEWFHNLGELSYPWLTLGYTQIYSHYWVQVSDLGGVWGASFLLVASNAILASVIIKNRNLRAAGENYSFWKTPGNLAKAGLLLVIIILPIVYGAFRIAEYGHDKLSSEKKNIRIGIIQPNINPWRKWDQSPIQQIRLHQHIQDSLSEAVGELDLAIWSETATSYINQEFNRRHNFRSLQNWIDRNGTALLTGFADFHVYGPEEDYPPTARDFPADSNSKYDTFNSALLLNAAPYDSLNPQIYHKMKLTPFAERLPYADLYPFAVEWFKWGVGISAWQLGKNQHNLTIMSDCCTTRIGPIICIESIYPEFCSDFTSKGAEILTVITNDAWYDYTPGPEQHYLIAAMRAIENRRYLARCANTGVSGFITPTGASILRAPQYTAVGIAGKIPLLDSVSPYVALGDWLPALCAIITIVVVIYSRFFRKR